jgi:CRISPR system Cascade subunit CasD
MLTDYHTVGGGYKTPQLLEATRKPKWTPGYEPHTELTWRDYLCDASFLVVVQGSADQIGLLAAAARAPVWPVYLGRKACVPSVPIYEGEGDYDSLAGALRRSWNNDRQYDPKTVAVRAVLETTRRDGVRRPHGFVSRSRRPHGAIYMTERFVDVECLPLVDAVEVIL